MIKFLLIFLMFIFFSSSAYAPLVKVDVKSVCQFDIKSFNIRESGLPTISMEIYNSGSVVFRFRVFMDALSKTWSKEYVLKPGEIVSLNLSFVPAETNRIKIFYCSDVFEKTFYVSRSSLISSNDFRVESIRSYGDFLIFDVYSNLTKNLFILASDYPEGWVFEYGNGYVKKGKNLIKVHNKPVGDEEVEIGFYLVSEDGFYTYQKAKIDKPKGLRFLFYYILDNIRLRLQNI